MNPTESLITADQWVALGAPEEYASLMAQGTALVQNILVASLLIAIGVWLSRMALRTTHNTLSSRNLDPALTRFLSSLVQWTVLLMTGIAAIQAVGVPTTSFIAVLGSAGIAVGLALQGTLSHFASGVMLLLFRPFTINDVVTVAGQTGRVDEIGLFATVLITLDNQRIIIPNSAVTSDTIVNLTSLGTRRAEVAVGVAYGVDIDRATEVLTRAIQNCPTVLSEPAPAVAVTGLGDSSVDLVLMGWCASSDYIPTLSALRVAAYNELDRAGIEIPFPQVVIHRADAVSEVAAK